MSVGRESDLESLSIEEKVARVAGDERLQERIRTVVRAGGPEGGAWPTAACLQPHELASLVDPLGGASEGETGAGLDVERFSHLDACENCRAAVSVGLHVDLAAAFVAVPRAKAPPALVPSPAEVAAVAAERTAEQHPVARYLGWFAAVAAIIVVLLLWRGFSG